MAMPTSALCKTNTNGSPFNLYVRKRYFPFPLTLSTLCIGSCFNNSFYFFYKENRLNPTINMLRLYFWQNLHNKPVSCTIFKIWTYEISMNFLSSSHHWLLNGHESEQALGVSDGQEAWRARLLGVAKSWTRLSDWTELNDTAVYSGSVSFFFTNDNKTDSYINRENIWTCKKNKNTFPWQNISIETEKMTRQIQLEFIHREWRVTDIAMRSTVSFCISTSCDNSIGHYHDSFTMGWAVQQVRRSRAWWCKCPRG